MADPFNTRIKRERLQTAGLLIVLVLTLALVGFVQSRMSDSEGRLIVGQVVSFGTEPTGIGDRPVVRVRLADGSTHQVLTTWFSLSKCKQGDRIHLVQSGSALKVGVRACDFDA